MKTPDTSSKTAATTKNVERWALAAFVCLLVAAVLVLTLWILSTFLAEQIDAVPLLFPVLWLLEIPVSLVGILCGITALVATHRSGKRGFVLALASIALLIPPLLFFSWLAIGLSQV